MNLDYFLTVTERESSSAADINSVLLDPSGWAQQAFKNLSLDAKVKFSLYQLIFIALIADC